MRVASPRGERWPWTLPRRRRSQFGPPGPICRRLGRARSAPAKDQASAATPGPERLLVLLGFAVRGGGSGARVVRDAGRSASRRERVAGREPTARRGARAVGKRVAAGTRERAERRQRSPWHDAIIQENAAQITQDASRGRTQEPQRRRNGLALEPGRALIRARQTGRSVARGGCERKRQPQTQDAKRRNSRTQSRRSGDSEGRTPEGTQMAGAGQRSTTAQAGARVAGAGSATQAA